MEMNCHLNEENKASFKISSKKKIVMLLRFVNVVQPSSNCLLSNETTVPRTKIYQMCFKISLRFKYNYNKMLCSIFMCWREVRSF